jgi:L-iditol 2-dehydrogenase
MINGGLDLTDFITQTVDLKHTQEGLDILSRKKENVVKVVVEF